MSLSFHTPWFVVLLLVAASGFLSAVLYRHTVPTVSNAKRYLLIFLRSSALSLIFLAVCEPLFRSVSVRSTLASVAVIADNSLSMSLTDASGNREHRLRALLAGASMKKLAAAMSVEYFRSSPKLIPLNPDSLRVDGTSTDLSSALQQVNKDVNKEFQGIVLLSDGNYNSGANPIFEAERSHLPLFTVGIGDSLEQHDISVSKLITNSIGYTGTAIPVDGTLRVTGFNSMNLTVSMTEDQKEVESKILSLPAGRSDEPSEYHVHFLYTPATDGMKTLSISVAPVRGELTAKNNTRSVNVKVLKSKMKITVIAGNPSADVTAVMQTLNADPNLESHLFLQKPDGSLEAEKHSVSLQQSLAGAECVIMAGFPVPWTSSGTIQGIQNIFRQRPLPLLFLASRTLDLQKLGPFDPWLPFSIVSGHNDEDLVAPSIPPAQQCQTLLQASSSSTVNFSWDKLPPIFYSRATFAAKPEAVVLSEVKVRSVPLKEPLMLYRNAAGVKSFAVLGYGIARWKLLAGASSETEKFFDLWFPPVVRWLSTNEKEKLLHVEPVKLSFSRNEEIDFIGESYDENFQPMDAGVIEVDVKAVPSGETFRTILRSLGSGRYEGTMDPLPDGKYHFVATRTTNSAEIVKTEGRFSVGDQSMEFADTKMNKPLMSQLAAVSGGEYADAAQFDKLVTDILVREDMQPRQRQTTREVELWNLPLLLSIVVVLFGVEWFLRKRSGML